MTIDIQRIQAICFDVDGTISDTDDVWVASLERRVLPLRRLLPRSDAHSCARWAIMCPFLDQFGLTGYFRAVATAQI